MAPLTLVKLASSDASTVIVPGSLDAVHVINPGALPCESTTRTAPVAAVHAIVKFCDFEIVRPVSDGATFVNASAVTTAPLNAWTVAPPERTFTRSPGTHFDEGVAVYVVPFGTS